MTHPKALGPSTYPFEAGTVLYSKLRPYLNKVVVADTDGYATTELVPLKCDASRVLPSYLAYFLRSSEFLNFANTVVAGAKMPRMVMGEFWQYKVPLPPLPEQRRITAILDKADALRTKRREALAELDRLAQSIFVEMFGDPAGANPSFGSVPLLELALGGFQNGAYFPKDAYSESGIEMVHMSDAFGGLVRRGQLRRVKCDGDDVSKYSLEKSDLLIARRSLTYEGAAKPCRVPYSSEPLLFESSFIRIRPDSSKVSTQFLFHYLNNERVREKFVRPFVTQSTISGINQSNLARVPVILPPGELQEKFELAVASLEGLSQTHRRSAAELHQLFLCAQDRAFRGEL
jgi:type I restriction enzyme S subunit